MYRRIRNLLDRAARETADRAAPIVAAGRALAGDPRGRIALPVAGGVVGLVVIGLIIAAFGRPATPTVTGSEEAWQYLVVCDACGQRQRVQSRPAVRQAQTCSVCGKGHLSSYRRGSQSLIPGGWAASQPATTTRAAKEGS